jgi:hypothetical protein
MSGLREWLSSPEEGSPAAPRSLEPLEPVGPCLEVSSPDYPPASLARKFRAATTGTIPGVLSVQRELQAVLRGRDLDLAAATRLLMVIEAHVREGGR